MDLTMRIAGLPLGIIENSPAIHCRGPSFPICLCPAGVNLHGLCVRKNFLAVFCPVGTTENSPAIHCWGKPNRRFARITGISRIKNKICAIFIICANLRFRC